MKSTLDRCVGEYRKGSGVATGGLRCVRDKIASLAGLPSLHDGTFNVVLEEHYPLTSVTGTIAEFSHQQCIKLRRCKVWATDRPSKVARGVVIRPSLHERPGRKHWRRLEVMSPRKLDEHLGVSFGDSVTVELEAEKQIDDSWWESAE